MRKIASRLAMPIGGVLVAVAYAVPASAHHGWGEYQEAQFEITGVLEESVSLAGSHGTAKIGADGDVWELVFAPSPRTARAGLDEDAIPVGHIVTASGHRHLDVAKREVKTERLTWNGKVFNIYPDRE